MNTTSRAGGAEVIESPPLHKFGLKFSCLNKKPPEFQGVGFFAFRIRADRPTPLPVPQPYSTVTDFARLRGWSTSVPLSTAT